MYQIHFIRFNLERVSKWTLEKKSLLRVSVSKEPLKNRLKVKTHGVEEDFYP